MCLITLHLPDTVRREMSSRIYCQFVSERWQFISNHYVSKIEGCAKVEIQLHSSQRWRAPLLHMRLQCACGLEIWPWQPASLFPTMDRAPDAAGLPLPKSAGPLCSEACSHIPYLPSPLIQSLLTRSSRLYSTILMYPLAFWAFTLLSIWETTFPIKLQIELGPASTSYATLTVTLSEMKTLASPVLCTTLATSSNSPVLESGVILQYAKTRQDKTTP